MKNSRTRTERFRSTRLETHTSGDSLSRVTSAVTSRTPATASAELASRSRAMRYPPAADRLWAKVDSQDPDSCWNWLGSKYRGGYGKIYAYGQRWGTHRLAYELAVGPIPPGYEVDHLCKNPSCVNPAHLEAVTQYENNMGRSDSPHARNARKTHCPQGHEYTAETMYQGEGRRGRDCKICKRKRTREWMQARRDRERERPEHPYQPALWVDREPDPRYPPDGLPEFNSFPKGY